MDKIKYIIDFDGFNLSRGFLIKEACVLNVVDKTIKSYFINVGEYEALNEADRRQADWLTRNLHGLAFSSDRQPNDLSSQEVFFSILADLIEDCRKCDMRIAYKGGIYERNILRALNCDCDVDLESAYNCPTAKELMLLLLPSSVLHCKRHKGTAKMMAHCPKVECFLYYRWILQQQQQQPQQIILSEHFW